MTRSNAVLKYRGLLINKQLKGDTVPTLKSEAKRQLQHLLSERNAFYSAVFQQQSVVAQLPKAP